MSTRTLSVKTGRRGMYGMLVGGLLTGVAVIGAAAAILAPSANATPAQPVGPDQCSASAMADTSSSVSAQMGSYLEAHPQTNEALTDISKQPAAQAPAAYHTYFANNPQVADDLKAIQQPVNELTSQCNTQVAPNALTDALKAT